MIVEEMIVDEMKKETEVLTVTEMIREVETIIHEIKERKVEVDQNHLYLSRESNLANLFLTITGEREHYLMLLLNKW
jgi:hypothetical protein